MPALTPSFLFDFETGLMTIMENEYARLTTELWWQRITKVRPSQSKKEIVAWLLSTVNFDDQGYGGNIRFNDMVALNTTFVNLDSGTGLKMRRQELEDLEAHGMDIATNWATQIGAYMAYWPQKAVVSLLTGGESGLAYDGKAFFASDHPLNPYNTAVGTYCNIFTGSGGVGYNAAPIDTTNAATVEIALKNLSYVYAGIRRVKMPDGVTPRFMKPMYIAHPPALTARVQQLTNARFIAQSAGTGGGGSGDVTGIITNMGFAQPIEVVELAGVDDTSYYVICQEAGSSQLGAFVYVNREPYGVTFYTGQGGGTGVSAELDRAQELEWHCHGRNVAGYGHPFYAFKVKAT